MKPLCAILGFLSASAALLVGASSAQAATASLSSIPNACWTTEQPFTLVENEYAKLTWDTYGNLTLTNHGGNGSSISWGLDSPNPLTGSNAGKLCFGNGATRLRIHTSTGTTVWNSGLDSNGQSIYSTLNGILSINGCTIRIKDTNGAVMWEESLPQCELRSRRTPAVTKCWSKSDTQLILSAEDLGRELHWEGGNLWLRGKDGLNSPFMVSGTNSKELCHQSNGDFVIFDTNGNVLKHLGYGENISLDECGIEYWSNWTLPGYTKPHKLIRQQTKAIGTCTRRSAVKDWVCWDRSASGTILQSGFTRLDWTSDGRLKMLDNANNQLWSHGASNQNDRFCVMDDGNLQFYKYASGALNGAGLDTFRSRVASTAAKNEVLDALPTTGLPSNYAEVIADGGANVTLFGEPYTLVEGIASAEINNGHQDMVKVMVGGATVYSANAFGVFNHEVPRTFLSKDAQFVVGGIPITATFEATGTVGMWGNVDYNQNSNDLTCTITPFASVDAFGSIGIGVTGFSLGVEGELNLVSVGFPLTNKLNISTKNYTARSDFTISSLEGSLSLYADATFVKATKEIVSIDGYSASTTLFKVNGLLAP